MAIIVSYYATFDDCYAIKTTSTVFAIWIWKKKYEYHTVSNIAMNFKRYKFSYNKTTLLTSCNSHSKRSDTLTAPSMFNTRQHYDSVDWICTHVAHTCWKCTQNGKLKQNSSYESESLYEGTQLHSKLFSENQIECATIYLCTCLDTCTYTYVHKNINCNFSSEKGKLFRVETSTKIFINVTVVKLLSSTQQQHSKQDSKASDGKFP